MTQIVEILPTPSEKLPWLTRRLVSFTSGTATLAVFTLETDYPSDGLTALIGNFSNDYGDGDGDGDGDGNENVNKAAGRLCTCIALFGTFLCRHCTTST